MFIFIFAALGYLYSAISLNLIRPENARAVLAAGCLLGGMDELCQYSYNVCRQSMSVDTIGGWVEFIDSIPSQGDGTATPDLPSTSVFGQYAQKLRDDVFHFLVVTLPEVLDVQRPNQEPSSGPSGRDVLLQIYSRVPFDMFKSAVESPTFMIGQCISNRCDVPTLIFMFYRHRPSAFQIRERGNRNTKTRHRSGSWCRGDGGIGVWTEQLWEQCCARHAKTA
jgi:hypothetical protein